MTRTFEEVINIPEPEQSDGHEHRIHAGLEHAVKDSAQYNNDKTNAMKFSLGR